VRRQTHDCLPSDAGKAIVGLASHWPCVTDFSGLSAYGLTTYEREMNTHLHSRECSDYEVSGSIIL